MNMQLFIHAANVGADGINADAQLVGGLFVSQSPGQQSSTISSREVSGFVSVVRPAF